jgi:hypothetical protein
MCHAWRLKCSGRHCGSKQDFVYGPCEKSRRAFGCKITYDPTPKGVRFTCTRCRGGYNVSYEIEIPEDVMAKEKLEKQSLSFLPRATPGYYEGVSTTVTYLSR